MNKKKDTVKNCIGLVLAGGQGSRFWPLSTPEMPKQFLLFGNKNESLIQATANRTKSVVDDFIVVTSSNYKEITEKHLPDKKIICEPCRRNTAPAIGLAAAYVQRFYPESVILSLHSDHAISEDAVYQSILEKGIEYAKENEAIVLLGVNPTFPAVGYGYIEQGEVLTESISNIVQFKEKPDFKTAESYIKTKKFFWNSGNFIFKPSVILNTFKEFLPEIYQSLLVIQEAFGTENEEKVIKAEYEKMESISIDNGILEKSQINKLLTGDDFGWNDIGSYDSYSEYLEKDTENNRTRGNINTLEANDNIVISTNKNITLFGVNDLCVVESDKNILVCPKNRVSEIGKINS